MDAKGLVGTYVPDGLILVAQFRSPELVQYRVYRTGQLVKSVGETAVVLREGESAEFSRSVESFYKDVYTVTELVTNVGGQEKITEAPSQKEAKKAFAREQAELINGLGFRPDRAYAIIKAAGPGQAFAAAQWVMESITHLEGSGANRQAARDVLDCLLLGKFGSERMRGALEAVGLTVPQAKSPRTFIRLLHGATVTLHGRLPGDPEPRRRTW